MGMDVYGKNPKILDKKPNIEWETATDDEKSIYFNQVNEWEANNPGAYFRANCWSWRPIHAICDFAITKAELSIDTNRWGENSGYGLETQEECTMLANAISLYLLINNAAMYEDDDRIYLCLGSWCTNSGGFIDEEKSDALNKIHAIGTIMYSGVISENGELVFPSHSSSLSHIKSFIKFLHRCGGFEIW